jgi:hypothetical protein
MTTRAAFQSQPAADQARRSRSRYRHVHSFIDRHGAPRLYFRRRGQPQTALPGPIGSPEFVLAYRAALKEPAIMPSSLRGGVVARRNRQDPNALQPLIGVYLLLLKGRIVYVGSSLNMPKRVAERRSNGRPFDQAFYIATTAKQREALERTLIRAINPWQNHRHCSPGAEQDERGCAQ